MEPTRAVVVKEYFILKAVVSLVGKWKVRSGRDKRWTRYFVKV